MQIEQKTTPHIQGEIVLLDRVYFASFINFDFSVLVGCLFALYIFALPKSVAPINCSFIGFSLCAPPKKKVFWKIELYNTWQRRKVMASIANPVTVWKLSKYIFNNGMLVGRYVMLIFINLEQATEQ